MRRRPSIPAVLALSLAAGLVATPALAQDTLDKIKSQKAITLGVRQDARPFSFLDGEGLAKGYSVSLCEAVVRQLKTQLELPEIEVKYALTTAEDRFQRLAAGEVDLDCGVTTYQLNRLNEAEFSLLIYATGADLLVRAADEVQGMPDLQEKIIGVVAGTSAEADIAQILGASGMVATVEPVETYSDLLASLETGEIDAAYGDRALLLDARERAIDRTALEVVGAQYSYEPYALALRHGDNAFRHAVDSALARIYRTAEAQAIYEAWFGPLADNPDMDELYRVLGLPD
jgi:ABC-type amino acid transport substrate-binding protein